MVTKKKRKLRKFKKQQAKKQQAKKQTPSIPKVETASKISFPKGIDMNVPQEEVEALARKKWEQAGKPHNQDDKFYYQALDELMQQKKRVEDRESCREVYRDERLHVVEYDPQVRVCKFAIHGQKFQHYMAMPYMQFTRFLGSQGLSLHVSFTSQPVEDINQDVFFPPLPNVWWPSLQVCLMQCPGTSFNDVMRDFWNTRYLDCEDWYCFPVLEKETPMKSYKRWERMTLEDPTFILDVNWTHPACIAKIPEFDHGGIQADQKFMGKKEYGGSLTNRFNGPIRGFAVVAYGDGRRQRVLD